MFNLDILLNYLSKSSFVTIIVLVWLSIYFIITFSILFYRYFSLSSWQKREQRSLEAILLGSDIKNTNSMLRNYALNEINRVKLDVCVEAAKKRSTVGLVWLSIIASTSPFIGLFGTVVGILDTFSKIANSDLGITSIAPAISEALVATGCGIFVAVPAYTFHLLIKRKSYELINTLKREVDLIALNFDNSGKTDV